MNHLWKTVLMVIIAGACAAPLQGARLYGGLYTKERLANAQRNCEKFDWAAKRRDQATSPAKEWVSKSDDELWKMVPGQDLPRCIDVTLDRLTSGPTRLGCLSCGDKIFGYGNYPYEPDFRNRPWKLTCPACGAVFPTNDFGKYYESAIDEHGLFNPAKGDKSLLFNTAHPDPADPLHKFGVDDGFGYIDKDGRSHKFIAYYTWKHWRRINSALATLGDAYIYTGDKVYAHKAAILLDRIADVYPDMEWKVYADRGWFHSDGGSNLGKIEGRIWECAFMATIAEAYEQVLSGTDGDDELYAFLKKKSEQYRLPGPKGTRELFVKNCDDGILRCAAKSMMSGQVYGNEGMHQLSMATFATALNTNPETEQWLDWLFEPKGGALPSYVVGKMDRDGIGPEAGPGYALMWGTHFSRVANRIADYGLYKKHQIYSDFPQFKACFTAAWNLCLLGIATPCIGDSGATGAAGRSNFDVQAIARAFRDSGDPQMAVAAYRANGNSGAGLGRDILAADPDATAGKIEEIGSKAGPRPITGVNLSGYGMASLEAADTSGGKALDCYYGRTWGHGHQDQLNFDLLAFGKWLAPDQGYPEFATAWPSRSAWTLNTLSHNTVSIDQAPQKENYGGYTRLFRQLPGLGVLELSCPAAYPQAKEYARTMLLVTAPEGGDVYAVDIFRAEGGNDHVMSFHGPPGAIVAEGLKLQPQATGTYAGADIPFAADKGPLGYSYLYNVKRDAAPSAAFQLDWTAEDGYRGLPKDYGLHLRYHVLTPSMDVALADGDPPQNKPGNPRRLGYALMHRKGANLQSTFAAIIEPYRHKPIIRKVERLGDASPESTQAVIRVTLADGSIDTIFWNAKPGRIEADAGTSFDGKVGFLRTRGDKVTSAVLVQGTSLQHGQDTFKAAPEFSGTVARRNDKLSGGGWMWLKGNVPVDGSAVGQPIIVENDGVRNACYTIQSAEKDGDLVKINCGPISFVRGYKGAIESVRHMDIPVDYSQGFLYDFEEGAKFTIPNHAVLK